MNGPADEISALGFSRIVLLLPAGSDLVPELLARTLGPSPRIPVLRLVDARDPRRIRAVEREADPARTLFVVDEPNPALSDGARQFLVPARLEQEAA